MRHARLHRQCVLLPVGKHLPIANITAIHFSRPIFAAVVAAIVLGEPLRGSRIPAIGLGIVGAAIIIRPGIIDVNIGVLYVLGW